MGQNTMTKFEVGDEVLIRLHDGYTGLDTGREDHGSVYRVTPFGAYEIHFDDNTYCVVEPSKVRPVIVTVDDTVGNEGLVKVSRARSTGVVVGLYDNTKTTQFDPDGGRWVTLCEQHSTLVNHETRKLAESFMASPESWCERCQDIAAIPEDEPRPGWCAWTTIATMHGQTVRVCRSGDPVIGVAVHSDPEIPDRLVCAVHAERARSFGAWSVVEFESTGMIR